MGERSEATRAKVAIGTLRPRATPDAPPATGAPAEGWSPLDLSATSSSSSDSGQHTAIEKRRCSDASGTRRSSDDFFLSGIFD